MPDIKSNENEFKSQVNFWLNGFLSSGSYPFELASSDPSVKVSDKKTKFPDVQIWLNRKAQQGFCGWELKTPATPIDDSELLENAAEKAGAMNADWFVTWNMRDSIIWRTPHPGTKVTAEYRYHSYRPLYQVSVPDDLWTETNNILLKNRAKEILDDLARLHHEGHLHLIDIDATYFVGRLNDAVKTLYPHVQKSLMERLGCDAPFKNSLFDWAVKQSMANYDDPSFYETVSRQTVYRLLARILFYQTLRRQWNNLPKIDISALDSEAASKSLRDTFSEARQIDWHAVFEEDFLDSISIPNEAINELDKLIKDLNRFNFSIMPQDVIGAVFEKLIPPEERHSLGQYFTRENLVDLIAAFCVRTRDAHVLDPTCGTGTFLTRAYDKMKILGQAEHKNLLAQIWGIDIAHFPAELATINLFRQNLTDYANFPRIICQDFFGVRPEQSFKFPPPKVGYQSGFELIEEKLPSFDAAIGNFPYIRQELIEKRDKGYKRLLEQTLKEEWLADYPDVFIISDKDLRGIKDGVTADLSQVGFRLSGQADIYAYLFFHTARFLKEGGRMGFVTSNSWLDVAYGYELQKFLVNNFKIIAILESRCEPWFEDPAVNTIVTIVERCSNKQERDSHIAKFVKVKRKLSHLMPWDMKLEAQKRWLALDGLAHRIESVGKQYYKLEKTAIVNTLSGLESSEDDDFRVRFTKQSELLGKLLVEGKTAKWGQYLRAPQVYFDIIKEHGDKFAQLKDVSEIRSGIKTGVNEFFYFTEEKAAHWGIEKEFLIPVIKSPRESDSITVSPDKLKQKIFICNSTKGGLKKQKKLGALNYIEWGEQQMTNEGKSWSEVSSVSGRARWYDLGKRSPGKILPFINSGDIHRVLYNPEKVFVDHNLFEIYAETDIEFGLVLYLNSSLAGLFKEINGRANLGEGGLKVEGVDWETMPCAKKEILTVLSNLDKEGFNDIFSRPVRPVPEEIKIKDRQKLDSQILQALGLDPDKYLKPIYDGLTELVKERMELAGMRKKVKQIKTERDVERLKKQVLDEVLPYGVKKFPDEFLETSLKLQDYQSVPVPAEPLKLGMFFLGTQEVVSDSGFHYQAQSVEEANYIIYSQKPDTFMVNLPKDPVVITKAVKDYEIYLDKIRDNLFQEFFKRTFDHKLSETLTRKTMNELGLPQ